MRARPPAQLPAAPADHHKAALEDILALRGLQIPNKTLYERAFEVHVQTNLSFADAYNAAYMAALNLTEIYSFDADVDRLPGVTRVEPDDERR